MSLQDKAIPWILVVVGGYFGLLTWGEDDATIGSGRKLQELLLLLGGERRERRVLKLMKNREGKLQGGEKKKRRRENFAWLVGWLVVLFSLEY